MLLNVLIASPTFAKLALSSNMATQLRSLSSFAEEVSTKFALTSARHVVNVYQQVEEKAKSKLVRLTITFPQTVLTIMLTDLPR